jgi:large subunit ribosomal protein L24
MKRKLKVGDDVIIISGRERMKKGKILRFYKKNAKVLIKGINIKKKHQKKSHNNKKGQILYKEYPIDYSNIKSLKDFYKNRS